MQLGGMYFMDSGHVERFAAVMSDSQWLYEDGGVDRYFGTAYYLLTTTAKIWQKCKNNVHDKGSPEIDFDSILAHQVFSSAEKSIVLLARELFKNEDSNELSVIKMVNNLDKYLLNCCLYALAYFKNGMNISTIKKAASVGSE